MVGWPGAGQDRLLASSRVLGLAVLAFRGDLAKDAELLVLRHENAVLAAMSAGCGYERRPDGFAALARLLPAGAGPSSFP